MEPNGTKTTRPVVGGISLDTPERRRAYIAAVQRDLNVHLKKLGSPTVLAVDGEWDSDTQLAFERVSRILGLEPVQDVRSFRLIAASAAKRTDAEQGRAKTDGTAFAKQLKEQFTGNGQPVARKRERTVVGGRSLAKEGRAEAYVAALQRDLNRHLIALGSPTILAVDGKWDRDTDVAFRRVLLPGARARGRSHRARVPRRRRRRRAAERGGARARRLRRQGLRAQAAPPLRERAGPQAEARTEARAAARPPEGRAEGRRARYEDAIVREAKRHSVPVSLVCAVLEVETGFRNVFGHDKVANPIKSPPRGLLAVNEARYKQYLHFRRQGLGAQGVGPMQLTSPGLQDRADALGGCWKVAPNIRVGVEYLAGNIQRLGLYRGVAAYNGSTAYADKVLPLEKKWRAKLGAHADADTGGGSGPRTLRMRSPRMTGSDVKALQKLCNKRFEEWKVGVQIDVDGEFGPETRKASRRVAYGLGLDATKGITPALRSKMRRPSRRTAAELERAKSRRGWLRKLRRAHAATERRQREVPAGRARADHRPAVPGHAHARQLAVRQRDGHPDPERDAGDRARRRRDREGLQRPVGRHRGLAGDPAQRGQRLVLRASQDDHGARRTARAQGTGDRHLGLRQRRAASPHRTAGRTAAIPVRELTMDDFQIDDDDAVLAEDGPLEIGGALVTQLEAPVLDSEQDLDALFGEDEDEEDLGEDDLELPEEPEAEHEAPRSRLRAGRRARRDARERGQGAGRRPGQAREEGASGAR